ncbi:leucyl aminopeptidase [Methylobacterium persicinum]|uniref:Leucyl aminopeptidase n=2 Tax=Methylobacterium persicinum TaxID=374426 RepID=A0ABU0HQA6_9HYPH|nr:leucyl aminopeptidase [Methylobacterium persicinum]GJE37596.1 putative cytosol aminopeptidase [Methylobacterium persicinum]
MSQAAAESSSIAALLPTDTPAIGVACMRASGWEDGLNPAERAFAWATGFTGKPGSIAFLPGADGNLSRILFGLGDPDAPGADALVTGRLPGLLPAGSYRLEGAPDPVMASLAWLLGSYRFDRYRKGENGKAALVAPEGIETEEVSRVAAAVALGRDLVNTPANDLGPAEIEAAARALAERHGAAITVVQGADLERDFPLIHAVGAAAARAPRLIDLTWGPQDAPRVTLIGKGVAFDTGGLDIKPSSAMLLMKKDMGGAAVALAVADMVMGAGLKLRLRVLVPAVENSVAGNAFRPGDVLRSRAGLSVEIGNTDAEGRLILADALALADADAPEMILDFSTLTGAARVALGPDLPAFFTEDEDLAQEVAAAGARAFDPVWRMPLHQPYASLLESKVADLNNVSNGPFAGAITAALFLRRFAPKTKRHGHFDLYGWNPSTKPGRPEGGEVQTARLSYALLKARYGG